MFETRQQKSGQTRGRNTPTAALSSVVARCFRKRREIIFRLQRAAQAIESSQLVAAHSLLRRAGSGVVRQFVSRLLLTGSVLLLSLWTIGDSTVALGADDSAADFFERRIRPVLVEHCYECHSASTKPIGSRLKLDSREAVLRGGESGAALVPGRPDQSLLIAALRYDSVEMPPGGKLSESVIADFEHWIQAGAFDPRTGSATLPTEPVIDPALLWSFRPLVEPTIPELPDAAGAADDGVASPIDRLVAAKSAGHGLTPVAEASPEVLLRRLYYDLIGLPPTADEIDDFVRDPSIERYSETVDRLLASPLSGERWGRYWLDLARFAESNGSDRNIVFPYAWRYRDYVIRSFNADKPFDQFVREQIAGDLLPSDDWQQRDEQLVATGFLAIGPKLLGEGNKELFALNLIDEQIDVTSRAILGLTVSCARCHDHKFDPVSTRDYYALAGIFGSSTTLYGPMTPANEYGFDRPLQPLGEHGVALDLPAQKFRTEVAEAVTVRNKARSDRYRVVRQKAALDEKKKKQTDAAEIATTDAEIAKLDAEIAEWDQKVKLLEDAVETLEDNPPEFPDYCMAVRESDAAQDCAIRIRGEAARSGDVVPRGVPELFRTAGTGAFDESRKALMHSDERGEPGELSRETESPAVTEPSKAESPATSRRLELAHWLTADANPLTPRVAVNRIWQRLFGEGLVRTVDNFGANGEPPSHPELLDWLALRFRDDRWSVKATIRRIVHSRTYRLASAASESNSAIDPANRMLWRARTRRLDAEALRDSLLFVSGELDLTPAGPSAISTVTEREFNDRVFPSDEQLDTRHRAVYLPVVRYRLPEMLREFDFADPNLVIGRRDERTMPGQSLFFMNSDFVVGRARRVSELLIEQNESASERVRLAFRRILSRDPSPDEISQTTRFVAAFDDRSLGWTAVCQALLSSAEFRFVP